MEQTKERAIALSVCLIATFAGLSIPLASYGSGFPKETIPSSSLTASQTSEPIGVVSSNFLVASTPANGQQSSKSTSTLTPTVAPTATNIPDPTATPTTTNTPAPSKTPIPATPTPHIELSGFSEQCEPEVYSGIRHCTLGPYQILRINPKDPAVRFETVLPLGFDRYGNYGECRDVYVPDTIDPSMSPGPGCHNGSGYPGERIPHMASRYPGAVAGFNGDFFSPTYAFGPMGLTVKNGERLDGYFNDNNIRETRRSSLSISLSGDIRIGTIPPEELPDPKEPWTWVPDPETYYNSIGGLPLLVSNGHPVDLHNRCILEEGWCPAQYIPRARTAFGQTFSGEAIVLVAPEEWGVTLETLSYLMVELGASEAINLDGGGSSQLWYAGQDLVYSARPVAEGMLVFSSVTLVLDE